jgi:uncharacterized membrane protein YdbT with pleckstrin-like domain
MIARMVAESKLANGERVVFHAHSHWKNIFWPVVLLVALGVLLTVTLLEWLPDTEGQAVARWAVIVVAAVLALSLGVWPVVVWLASTDTLTTRRLISRSGVFSREGRDIPIDRIQAVSYRRTLLDRMLGCGTLIVQTAGEGADVELTDVAHLERRLLQVQEIILEEDIPAEGQEDGWGEQAPRRDPRDGL